MQFLVKVICPLLFRLVLLVTQRRELWIFCSCRSSLVVDIPVMVQRPIPMVFACSEDHRDSAAQYFSLWSVPCCAGRACCARCCYDRLAWFRLCSYLWRFRSRSSFRLWTPLCYAATSCLKVLQFQFIAGVSGHFSRHRDRYAQFLLCMFGIMAAMRGSLLQFCSIFRLRPSGR